MEWFRHSTTARYNELLKKLEHLYGLAALGFFWKAVELIKFSNGEVSLGAVLALRARPLRYIQVVAIVKNTDFFRCDSEHAVVRLSEKVESELFAQPKGKSLTCAHTEAHTEACTNAGAEARTEASTYARREASVQAVPIETNLEKSESERKRTHTHAHEPDQALRDEQALLEYLSSKCPVLMEMEEPLTIDQYYELKQKYQKSDIERVLLDMQNDVNITSNRSCYLTAVKWLTYRLAKPGK